MNPRHRIWPYFLFLAVNLLQAWLTPIAKDEAYYWMYSQHLDWGFFDHPPMVAAMIWLGSSLFACPFGEGALGVRLLTTLLLTASLPVIWATLDEKIREKPENFLLFLLLVAAAPIFNIYGFITTPDAPLLFFAALYLWAFKHFVKMPSLKWAVLLGVFMAGMAWSKYHGALVVIFTVIAHWRVLKEKYFYLAALVALALFSPHLIWQYSHDFLTFRFHLGGRAKDAMEFHNVTEYFLNTLIILNPLILIPFLYAWFKKLRLIRSAAPAPTTKVEGNTVEGYVFGGFLAFFALSTIKGHVEPHWIAVAGIAMVILTMKLADGNAKLHKLLKILALITIPLVLFLRVALMLPLDLPTEFHRKGASHYQAIQEAAGNADVIFANSYTDAAKYTFYTGAPAWSYNNIFYRPNQYDLWELRDHTHGNEAFFINDWTEGFFDTLDVGERRVFYKRIPDFQLPQYLQVELLEFPDPITDPSRIEVKIKVENVGTKVLDMQNVVVPISFSAFLTEGRRKFYTRVLITRTPDRFLPGEHVVLEGHFETDAPPGEYLLGIGVKPGKIPEVLGSDYVKVRVED